MNSPSPSKPKWSGAFRRGTSILSMGRSKTPSRSSSIHESDSSPLKGVVAAPTSPIPKSVSPKSTLSTGSPSKEPTVTPSKSTLARMGTVLRRSSSLIPRRRTTSTTSSCRDVDSMPSKTTSVGHPSTESKPIPAAEPATESKVISELEVLEPRPSVSEFAHVPPAVIESTKTQFTDRSEEIPPQGVIRQSLLSTSHEHAALTIKEACDESLASSTAELAPIAIVTERISVRPKADKSLALISSAEPAEQFSSQPEAEPSSLVPISTVELVSEQTNAQTEAEKSSLAPIPSAEPASKQVSTHPKAELSSLASTSTAESVSEQPNAQSSPAPISSAEPASKQISTHPEAETSSLAPVSPVEQTSIHPGVEESHTVPHSTAEPVPTPSVTDAVGPSPEAEKQPAVFIISTTHAVPASIASEPTDSTQKVVEDALPSSGPATHDAIVQEPSVVSSPSPVVDTSVASLTPEYNIAEPLREVSSLNSSFEDLALSSPPTEDDVVVLQKDAVVDHPSVLLMPVDIASVLSETKGKEKASPVAFVSATKESSSIRPEPVLEVTKEGDYPVVTKALAPAVSVFPSTQQQLEPVQRNLPLEIPTTSVESAVPSPAATHPLLLFEVQESSSRQNNTLLGHARDHHTKTPQEYRSMLRKLLDGLVDLIKHWRRCLCEQALRFLLIYDAST
ncbi:hypothetical protein C0989_010731 [Termitomyces sp. Mn162]|nr:hypothetical protein C0989_010731 [Termitomyces sp. Mn162]